MVNWRTEIRFLVICGDTRTLLRRKVGDNSVDPVAVTGKVEPLPTTIDEGVGYHGKRTCEREEDWDVMLGAEGGAFSVVVLKAEASAVGSQEGRPATGL
jgi:hypothetical protein